MSMPYIRDLDIDAANDAYAKTDTARARLISRANISRAIAATLDGTLLNCRIEDAVRALFPAFRVAYSGSPERKTLYITTDPERPADSRVTIQIGVKGQRRVNGSELLTAAARDEEEAARLAGVMAVFYDRLAQYNAMAGYMRSIAKDLQSVMIYTNLFH
jgi:hypothetical protein